MQQKSNICIYFRQNHRVHSGKDEYPCPLASCCSGEVLGNEVYWKVMENSYGHDHWCNLMTVLSRQGGGGWEIVKAMEVVDRREVDDGGMVRKDGRCCSKGRWGSVLRTGRLVLTSIQSNQISSSQSVKSTVFVMCHQKHNSDSDSFQCVCVLIIFKLFSTF